MNLYLLYISDMMAHLSLYTLEIKVADHTIWLILLECQESSIVQLR